MEIRVKQPPKLSPTAIAMLRAIAERNAKIAATEAEYRDRIEALREELTAEDELILMRRDS